MSETCPECKRPKATCHVHLLDSGRCPKWYATRDQMAEDDCRRRVELLGEDTAGARDKPATPSIPDATAESFAVFIRGDQDELEQHTHWITLERAQVHRANLHQRIREGALILARCDS